MKKLIFLFTMVLAVNFAMAQNTATTTQTGGNQEATVTQTGSSATVVTQSTDDNYAQKATVTQSGALNTVNVNQVETGSGSNSTNYAAVSTVSQTGDKNDADVDVFETGDGNKGGLITTLTQNGNLNTGIQNLTAPGYSSGHTVIGVQTGLNNLSTQLISGGYTNWYKVEQIGEANKATQKGTGSTYAEALITQDGKRNVGSQDIFGSNNGYGSAIIKIDQKGLDNNASQTFTGIGSSHQNNGIVIQLGDLNNATQVANGRSLDLQVTQTGNSNKASQSVTGDNYGLVPARGLIKVTQTGDDNEATQTANGNGIIGTILQEGNLNDAFMTQTGNLHTATITQTGNSNLATVTQN